MAPGKPGLRPRKRDRDPARAAGYAAGLARLYPRGECGGSTVALVENLGGRLLVAPRPDLFDGKVALFADPNGAMFRVLEWDALQTEGGK